MDGGSLQYRYGLMLFLFLLLFAVTATTSFSKSECENIAKSSGPVPQELIELCGDQEPADDAVSVSAVSAQAFGWEASLSTLDSLFLTIPEELTAIGPLMSPTADFISGCEFDNSGDFSEIYCISSSGEFFTSNTADASRTDIGVAPLFNGE